MGNAGWIKSGNAAKILGTAVKIPFITNPSFSIIISSISVCEAFNIKWTDLFKCNKSPLKA